MRDLEVQKVQEMCKMFICLVITSLLMFLPPPDSVPDKEIEPYPAD